MTSTPNSDGCPAAPCRQLGRHVLHAVADAQHRHAQLEHGLGGLGGGVTHHRLRSAGEDHAARRELLELGVTDVRPVYLAEHADLADPACDELGPLEPKSRIRMRSLCMFCWLMRFPVSNSRKALSGLPRGHSLR